MSLSKSSFRLGNTTVKVTHTHTDGTVSVGLATGQVIHGCKMKHFPLAVARLLFAATIALLTACTDEQAAIQTLEASGFTAVKTTGYSPFSCSDNDLSATGFIDPSPVR
jgi:hypothetical protein